MSPPAAPLPSANELSPPDPAQVARFAADVERLCAPGIDVSFLPKSALLPQAEEPGADLALAVSGGPDSMAMLLLAAAAFPERVIVATVDHGLRPEAAAEAAMVAELCAALGVPHETLTPSAPIAGSSIQMRAREVRYGLLGIWALRSGVGILLTAHHADDQAETLLMRLARGSGIAGLSAIRSSLVAHGVEIIRPLLGWRRAELAAIVRDSGAPCVDDPANRDERHDRTHFRALLGREPLLDPVALARSTASLAEADEALAWTAFTLWQERWSGADWTLRAADLPRELHRRLARQAIAMTRRRYRIADPRFEDATNVEALLDRLEAGKSATQGGVLVTPARDGRWHFAPAPPRRSH